MEETTLAVIEQPENIYRGISQNSFSDEITNILTRPIDPQEIEIRPDGIIYAPGVMYRNRLHEAFGRGGWAIVKINTWFDQTEGMMYFEGILYVHGQYISHAVGGQKYFRGGNMNYSDAFEGAKTDCITRCCKDLGIFGELWNPKFIKKFQDEYCVKVWCVNKQNKGRYFWRLKSSQPIKNFYYDKTYWNESDGQKQQSQPEKRGDIDAYKAEIKKAFDDGLINEDQMKINIMALESGNADRVITNFRKTMKMRQNRKTASGIDYAPDEFMREWRKRPDLHKVMTDFYQKLEFSGWDEVKVAFDLPDIDRDTFSHDDKICILYKMMKRYEEENTGRTDS